jgi:hypothetical protein
MKRFLLPLAVLLSVVAGGSVLAVDPLPELVAQTLQDVREQEKLSHDVYLYFSGLYVDQHPGQNIFARVTEAEQRHMDAVLQLLQKYGVADPVAVDGVVTAPGEFPDQAVEDLYAAYVEQGEAGLAQALEAAVAIETADIARLESGIAGESATYADILQVYTNLLASSQRHLAAFLKVLGQTDPDGELVATDVPACGSANGRW